MSTSPPPYPPASPGGGYALRGVVVADLLDELHGPAHGQVRLPLHLDASARALTRGCRPVPGRGRRLCLGAAEDRGFALVGGNALVAQGLVDRPTQDVDLFSPEPGAPGAVAEQVRRTLETAGYRVEVTRRRESTPSRWRCPDVARSSRRSPGRSGPADPSDLSDPSDDEFLDFLGLVKDSTGRTDNFCTAVLDAIGLRLLRRRDASHGRPGDSERCRRRVLRHVAAGGRTLRPDGAYEPRGRFPFWSCVAGGRSVPAVHSPERFWSRK